MKAYLIYLWPTVGLFLGSLSMMAWRSYRQTKKAQQWRQRHS